MPSKGQASDGAVPVAIARVAVEQALYHYDRPFDYRIPPELDDAAQPGCRVVVPFGTGDRTRQAIILERLTGSGAQLKSLADVPDRTPVLSAEMRQLAQWMKQACFCTLYDAVRLMLPAGIHLKLIEQFSVAPDTAIPADLRDGDAAVADFLRRYGGALSCSAIAKKCGMDPADCEPILRRLAAHGIVDCTRTAAQKMGDASVKMVRLCPVDPEPRWTARQKSVVAMLRKTGTASVREINYYTGASTAVLNTMASKGYLEYFDAVISRSRCAAAPDDRLDPDTIVLTDAQQAALDGLWAQRNAPDRKPNVALLQGVTGSGKTSVFLKLIRRVVRDGGNVILMVPEIALTPQLVTLFHRCFGSEIAVFHSGLSLGERMDEWKRVRSGEAHIAIGTRSAVFAPFDRVDLIVMDEEQENSYKSESAPRYHARDVARFRCAYHGGLLVLSSATPSVETRYAAETGRYTRFTLPHRYNGTLPEVRVVDQNDAPDGGVRDAIGPQLADAIADTLDQGKQTILLLNRRGYHTFVSCGACGEVRMCPNCSISLTYHAANRRLMCHYCGHSEPFSTKCPACGADSVRCAGLGTQRAEEELAERFPQARVLRMDTDTTAGRDAYEQKLTQFANGQFDIMVGTQMVAKGLNFPNVTLVGVLSADQALYGDDFRCYERAFSLLTQVVGRSGRGDSPGIAMIQTRTPENPIIALAAQQDYEAFYAGEIALRRVRLYPPFVDLCVVGFVGTDEALTRQAAERFLEMLAQLAQKDYPALPLRVFGPTAAAVLRVNQKYRFKLLLKCRASRDFREMMARLLVIHGKNRRFADVTAYADMNPDHIL